MSNSILLPSTHEKFKLPGSIIAGAFMAFVLFVAMAKLIENDQRVEVDPSSVTIPTFIFKAPTEKTIPKKQKLEPPKLVKPQPKPQHNQPETPGFDANLVQVSSPGGIDPIEIETNVSSTGDSFATPIVRIDPNYPTDAARDGKEGWVKLGFSIDIDGSVVDITVLDAEPKRVFDREARRALAKWKYKPQRNNGVAQIQRGMAVVLDFKLNQ